MTPLDIALHDEAARFYAREEIGRNGDLHERHTLAAREKHRELEESKCPTCGVAQLMVRAALGSRGASPLETKRVDVQGYDFRGAAYPYLASIEVDGCQVYRIHADFSEVLQEDVLRDIEGALKKGAA